VLLTQFVRRSTQFVRAQTLLVHFPAPDAAAIAAAAHTPPKLESLKAVARRQAALVMTLACSTAAPGENAQ
jgi:hypothetical protein